MSKCNNKLGSFHRERPFALRCYEVILVLHMDCFQTLKMSSTKSYKPEFQPRCIQNQYEQYVGKLDLLFMVFIASNKITVWWVITHEVETA